VALWAFRLTRADETAGHIKHRSGIVTHRTGLDILDAEMSFQAGDTIGDYQIVDVLGHGGMGKLFRVRNLISDRLEALKIIAPDLSRNPELADRFLREIKVHASLDHPNIAALRTAMRVGDQFAMVMELVEGKDLGEKLHDEPLEIRTAVDIADQVLSALAFAHARGVIHRDIKPANIMVTPAGLVKLTDFGIAHTMGDPRFTATGIALGSLFYMSPEQVSGQAVDGRADLYSLGVTLYHMVTGRRPFDGDAGPAILAAQMIMTPKPPDGLNPQIPAALSATILRAMEKEPAKRFQSAEEFHSVLRGRRNSCRNGRAADRSHRSLTPPRWRASNRTWPRWLGRSRGNSC
jgi:serine/threonine-protein kinase